MEKEKKKVYMCTTGESRKGRNTKAHSYTFYLDKIRELGGEFNKMEAVCTDGDIRPPYPYQWRAMTKVIKGDDDACEGLGGSPLEALRELYKDFEARVNTMPEDDE